MMSSQEMTTLVLFSQVYWLSLLHRLARLRLWVLLLVMLCYSHLLQPYQSLYLWVLVLQVPI